MRLSIAVLALTLISLPASAMSLKDFNAKPDKEQSAYIADFIDKMTTDLRAKNPEMAQQIRAWFARKQDAKTLSEGFERFLVETVALGDLANEGKVDLSKIQVEGVVVKIVKDKFPPPSQK
jgi:soluble cytochrome b562